MRRFSNLFQPVAFEAPGDNDRDYDAAALEARLRDNLSVLQSLNAEQVPALTAQDTDALRGVLTVGKPIVQDTDINLDTQGALSIVEGLTAVPTTGPEPFPFDLEFTNPYPGGEDGTAVEKPVVYEPIAIENTVAGKPVVSENVHVNEAVVSEVLGIQKPIVSEDITSLDIPDELAIITPARLDVQTVDTGPLSPVTPARSVIDLLPEGFLPDDSVIGGSFVLPGFDQLLTPVQFLPVDNFDLQIPFPIDFASNRFGARNVYEPLGIFGSRVQGFAEVSKFPIDPK